MARPKIHSHFKDALTQRFDRTKVTRFEPAKISLNPQRRYIIQLIKPIPVRRTVICRVFTNLKRTIHRVSSMLLKSNRASLRQLAEDGRRQP